MTAVDFNSIMESVDLNTGEVYYSPEYGYGQVAVTYLQLGYEPIPLRGKTHPPAGSTGYAGEVTPEKVSEWSQKRSEDNTGLRALDTYIALDIDHDYDGKTGADSIRELEADLGPLPLTVSSTARGAASESRQRFYRVPGGMHFVTKPCKDVEIIQRSHRYSVVEPSVHPATGQTYRWYGADGKQLVTPPSADTFAVLPEAWLKHLETQARIHTGEAFSSGELSATMQGLDQGQPGSALMDKLSDLDPNSYDDATSALWRLSYEVVNRPQTPGLGSLLALVYKAHLDSAEQRGRDREQRRADLDRSLAGALGKRREALAEAMADVTDAQRDWYQSRAVQAGKEQATTEEFWERRPYLQHVRDTAYKRVLSPWGLLGALLQRALMDAPYDVPYTSALGDANLNQMTAYVGNTGGAKSLTQKTLDDAFSMAADQWRSPMRKPGSGEGIVDSYNMLVQDKESKEWSVEWTTHNHAILWGYDEVGTLTSQNKRQGTTLFETLKEAESGSTLTRSLAGGNTKVLLGGQYRFCLYMNVQPAKADALLDDDATAGGLPGRILWMPTENATARADYISGPVTTFTVRPVIWDGITRILALEEMSKAHLESNMLAHEGKRDAEDSHSSLLKAKVTVALAILDGRRTLVPEDWELAEVIMQKSKETRDMVKAELKKAATKANQDAGVRDGFRRTTAASVQTSHGVDELVGWLRKNPGKVKSSEMPKRLRIYRVEAMEKLAAEGSAS